MPGHFSRDTSILAKYRPILFLYDSLANSNEQNAEVIINKMDDAWESMKDSMYIYERNSFLSVKEDIKYISSEYLINNIEQSFNTWLNSPYSDSVTFQEFCNYILPYRPRNGLSVEDWRTDFYKQHSKQLSQLYPAPLKVVVDSLLLQYKDFSYTTDILPDFPYMKVSDLKITKKAGCEGKCWFNSMLFASLGIPVAIDYIPAWGNRNGWHSWSVLIAGNDIHPFEPFGAVNKWKYKNLYDNASSDPKYGLFRLPKVFRYTFLTNKEAPIMNPNISVDDVPPVFAKTKFKDVSSEYFPTTDLDVKLTNIPEKTPYAYLCVFNSGRWIPVQWGEIKDNVGHFKDMGRDIIYLPAFYKNGSVIPAGDAFELDENGKLHYYKPASSASKITLKRKYPIYPYKLEWNESLTGGRFQGSNDPEFKNAEDLHIIDAAPEFYLDIKKIENIRSFRYVRFLFDEKKYGNLAELKFYTSHKDTLLPLRGKEIYSRELSNENVSKAFDNDVSSFMQPFNYDSQYTKPPWVGLDLGIKKKISAVGFCPRNDANNIFPGLNYELFYWDRQWRSLGIRKASKNYIMYSNVPEHALFLLKCLDGGKEERIFIINKEGQQIWK
jgi:hypothetical protein